jgi:multiple sugar transport system substrate-binding protein
MTTSIYPFFWGQGGALVDEKGEAVFGVGENREKMLKVFQFIKQLVDAGYLPQRAATYAAESDLNAEVAAGKTAMFLGGNWQVSQLKSIIGDGELEKWDAAPIPQNSGGRETTCNGGWVLGIFTDDPQKQALAFDLVSLLYFNGVGMAKWTSVAGYLPTRKSIYDHPDYDKNRFTTAFRKIIDSGGRLRPVADVYPKISLELQVALSSVVSGAKAPDQALSDAWFAVTGKR